MDALLNPQVPDSGISQTQQPASNGYHHISDPIDRLRHRLLNPTPEEIAADQKRQAERVEREEQDKNNRRARILNALIQQAGGDRYREYRVQNWEAKTDLQKRVKEAVAEWTNTFQERKKLCEGLVFLGPVGTGKDHLAMGAVGKVVFNFGVSAAWRNARSLAGEVRDLITENETEGSLLDRLISPDILVLSDPLPAIGEITAHQADVLYRIVEGRYAAGRLTIVTLNVKDDAEADKRLGPPVWDRLCQGAWKLHCNWPSHRQPARVIK